MLTKQIGRNSSSRTLGSIVGVKPFIRVTDVRSEKDLYTTLYVFKDDSRCKKDDTNMNEVAVFNITRGMMQWLSLDEIVYEVEVNEIVWSIKKEFE